MKGQRAARWAPLVAWMTAYFATYIVIAYAQPGPWASMSLLESAGAIAIAWLVGNFFEKRAERFIKGGRRG